MESVQVDDDVAPYVDGERIDTEQSLDVVDRTTDEVFVTVGVGDETTEQLALTSVANVLPRLRETTVPQRAMWCRTIADGLRNRSKEVADCLVREVGTPIARARSEVASAADQFDSVAEALDSLTGEHRTWTTDDRADVNVLAKADPLGVVRCLTASTTPLGTAAQQVAPALAAGNGVVLQPTAEASVASSILTEIVAETAVPTGAFNFVPGHGSVSDVAAVVQTVSSTTGVDIEQPTGRHQPTRDGDAPALVFADADIETAATDCVSVRPDARGGRWPTTPHVLAEQPVVDELITRLDARMGELVGGDLFDDDTTVAQLPDEATRKRVDELVADAVDRGATVVRGGTATGRYYEPTLLADVPPEAAIVHAGQSGPVVAVTAVESQTGAVDICNTVSPSLAVSVFTASHDRAMSVADALATSTVWINGAGDAITGMGGRGLHETITRLTRRKRVVC